MEKYNHKTIEDKWQKIWEEEGLFKVNDKSLKKKKYILDMFPYPSGEGLHVGHVESYTATDIYSRYLRMKDKGKYEVLHPQGWDAFGLPAENYAIKTGIHPAQTTKKAIETFKRQIRSLGFSYDWSREINSSEPSYYKWTQWFFLLLYKNGLAYKGRAKVNWCESCKTVLANEQAEGGKCERCGSQVVQKDLEQWFFRITDFIEDQEYKGRKIKGLLSGLDDVDWPESTKQGQRNWIGKSEGAIVKFKVKSQKSKVKITMQNAKVILVHGCPNRDDNNPKTRTYDKHWQPWIKNKLEKLGIKVNFPLMPHPWKPIYEDHKRVFEKLNIDENSILIGHSCGASFLVRWLGDTKKKIKKLILVAPWKEPNHKNQEKAEFYNFDIDSSIRERVEEVIVFTSDDEEKTGKESAKIFGKELKAKVIELKKHGHFTEGDMGKIEFPELLDVILNDFAVDSEIEVFTTRPDTLFGCTYMVVCPEHELIKNYESRIKNYEEIEKYIEESKKKSDLERTDLAKEKTGVKIEGLVAINPVNNEEIPIFVADYVLSDYGTGAIMAVPAHDSRDYEFAVKYGLPIRPVVLKQGKMCKSFVMGVDKQFKNYLAKINVKIVEETKDGFLKILIPFDKIEEYKALIREHMNNGFWNEFSISKGFYFIFKDKNGNIEEYKLNKENNDKIDTYSWQYNNETPPQEPENVYSWLAKNDFYQDILIHTEDGVNINSDFLDGLPTKEAKKKIIKWLEDKKLGKSAINYKLRDWLVSRQRYWGAPIPIIYCDKCGEVPVSEEDLPVELPDDVDFKPTGESPLKYSAKFHNVKCPKCGAPARRESDTMDTFVCSSWYYFRYADPNNADEFASQEALKKWLPVDVYVGGAEHTVLHLLYSRFFTKVLQKYGYIDFNEPFLKLRHQGIILGEDGDKMSKSKGNVINPDNVVKEYGADALRMYEMFMGPLEDMKPWNTKGIIGIKRFLERVWKLFQKFQSYNSQSPTNLKLQSQNSKFENLLHKTIKKVTEDIENFRFNTAISALMILINEMEKQDSLFIIHYSLFIKLLAPFAPHLSEELWQKLGHKESIFKESWPEYDPQLIKDETINLVVQVNGKLRDTIKVDAEISEEEAKKAAQSSGKIKKWIEGKKIVKVIFVKGRLINIVVKDSL